MPKIETFISNEQIDFIEYHKDYDGQSRSAWIKDAVAMKIKLYELMIEYIKGELTADEVLLKLK
jgi:hypothetical protein